MKDFCLDDTSVFVVNDIDIILQQIDILFDTNTDEVYGEDYGSEFYNLLWDMTKSAEDISDYTRRLILTNVVLFDWKVDVKTSFLEGTQNDIMLITIKLTDLNNRMVEKTYRID